MLPLDVIEAITNQAEYELRIELTDASAVAHFDSYTSFSISSSTYTISLGNKKASSASLASFDLSSVLQGVQFDAESSPCFAAH